MMGANKNGSAAAKNTFKKASTLLAVQFVDVAKVCLVNLL